ncbi:MAG TPA: mechanosensitive ion channel domain-containing protein [Gemmatimonadaceae bacterium]|nr:mechanosensitive ion channel domain-containing protein [Gemmatimonadaceae bacterium]
MPFWERAVIAAAAIILAGVTAKLVDNALTRTALAPEAVTRYRVVRRVVMSTIVFIGVLSALLIIPQVRAIAGGILASSAVVGLVIGFAAQRTLGNAIAGILIAFSQPLRLGDRVMVDETEGTVEEIGLTYTFIEAADKTRLVIPNEKLASDTIVNFTIRDPEKIAEITVQVPLETDLDAVFEELRAETTGDVFLSSLEDEAVITLREKAASVTEAERIAQDLRLRAHRRLRAAGVFK